MEAQTTRAPGLLMIAEASKHAEFIVNQVISSQAPCDPACNAATDIVKDPPSWIASRQWVLISVEIVSVL